jgi:hypothetical protein
MEHGRWLFAAAYAATAASHHIATAAPTLLSNQRTELRSLQVQHLQKNKSLKRAHRNSRKHHKVQVVEHAQVTGGN